MRVRWCSSTSRAPRSRNVWPGVLSVREALAVASQIADAIGAAHRKQIVHRDLKPSNVVLQGWSDATSGDPRVRILDFGIAKLDVEQATDSDLPTVTDKTRPGRVLGTRFYMSPEQARGDPVDKRTDIWSFGCLLFEMLAARRPFGNKGIVDTVTVILEQEPDWSALPGTPAIRSYSASSMSAQGSRQATPRHS